VDERVDIVVFIVDIVVACEAIVVSALERRVLRASIFPTIFPMREEVIGAPGAYSVELIVW
jgi:hypothetical protein